MITGKDLQSWGFKPGKWFKDAIVAANEMEAAGASRDFIFEAMQARQPVETLLRTNGIPFNVFLEPENDIERDNLKAVIGHMDELMRVPTIVAGAVMPDACPAGGQPGTIPVGGAVAAEDAIHPGFHSSDVCCSVAMTVLKRRDDPKRILDAVQAVTHFGPGGRDQILGQPPSEIAGLLSYNRFMKDLADYALYHFGTQGDGNHFAYVGHLRSTGQTVIVTHHGSRGLGAQLYKRGMQAAQRHTAIVAPRIPRHQAWLKASSDDGRAYWDALQAVRVWTRESHYAIHNAAARMLGNAVEDRFWNEHNFVFRRDDGLYYHGKGATPSWSGFSPDDDGRTLIPLNMSEPILIARHRDHKATLGFAPHGAGRNSSRTQHMRDNPDALGEELAALQASGLDIRSYCGVPDLSELPSAYKNAAAVRAQIDKFGLAEIIDEVVPYGSIMAGDWERDAPWRKKKA
jgi:tRNA-splicing ligase RtcB